MARALGDRRLDVDRWRLDVEEIRHLPGFSPVTIPYGDSFNVVGAHRASAHRGQSLILNGHIDVVPEGRTTCGPIRPTNRCVTGPGCTDAGPAT